MEGWAVDRQESAKSEDVEAIEKEAAKQQLLRDLLNVAAKPDQTLGRSGALPDT